MKNTIRPVRYLNTADAADYLTISERQLRYLRSAGQIKPVRISANRVLYRIVDLDRMIDRKLETAN